MNHSSTLQRPRHLHWAAACAALLALTTTSQVWAGAWTQNPGSFYIKTAFSMAFADEQLKCCIDSAQPLLTPSDRGDVGEWAINFYGEYGLPIDVPGGLTVLASTAYKFVEIDSEVALRRTQGLSDISLGVRWGIPVDISPGVLSLQVEAKLPTGYTANLSNAEQLPWLGNGVFELTSSLLAGYSFYPIPIYMTGGVGYRFRGDDDNELGPVAYEDEIPWGIEAGGTIADRVLLRAQLDGIAPLGDPGELSVAALTPPSSRALRLGGGVIVLIYEGLQANIDYTHVLDGVNVTLADQFTFGVAWAQ